MRTTVGCSISDCTEPYYANGYCEVHYQRDYDKRRRSLAPIPAAADCVECGEEFTPLSRRHRFCSSSCRMANGRRAYEERLGGKRAHRLRYRYNMSLADFDSLLADQGGVCAICETDPGDDGWHVDHDHACCPDKGLSCGACIRGLLCLACNTLLAFARDDPERLAGAMRYLQRP